MVVVADPDADPASPQGRDGLQASVATVNLEQREEFVRRRDRAAQRLDLRSRVLATRELQLPSRHAVLEPTAKRDPGAGERAAGSVVVRRREEPGVEPFALERRQLEAVRRLELQLTFKR